MSRRSDGEGSIRKRPDGRYEVRISIDKKFNGGQPKRISRYADTEEEAVRILHELSYMKAKQPKFFDQVTLSEWLRISLEIYMKNSLKQSTYISYVGYIKNHLDPALGNIPIQQLTPRMLQEFYNYKYEVEKLSPKTIVNLNLFLHRALSFALGEGYIALNPAEAVNLPRGQKPQIEILTRDEQARLIQASYRHRYGVFVRLVLFTGLRLGELLGLRWEDVDFRAGMLNVSRTLNRLNKIHPVSGEATTEIVLQTPKSDNSVRSIPLLQQVLRDLQNWRGVQQSDKSSNPNYADSGMIVTNPLGRHIEPRTFKDYYNQILGLAGLRHFTFHALRHTFASRAMEQGMDAKTLSVILGHYSVAFTMDTYTHVLDCHKKEAMGIMEELFDMTGSGEENRYPIIVAQNPDGMLFSAPDFPGIEYETQDFQEGLRFMSEQIEESVLTMPMPPMATPVGAVNVLPGQAVVFAG